MAKAKKIKTTETHEVFQMLRTCSPKMEGAAQRLVNGASVAAKPFVWKEGEMLVAEDYDPSPVCGGGLHGLKNGIGNWGLLDWDPECVGVIFENVDCPVIDIGGDKVKVQRARIIETGPFPAMLAKFLPTVIKELTVAAEINVITVAPSKATNDNGGNSAQIGSSGDYAQIGSSGDYAQIGSSGDYAQIGSSGNSAQIGSSGNSAQIGSSGYSAKIGSSGDSAQIGSSGNSAQIGSSGDYAQIGSSGGYAKIGSSGYSAKIGSSGNSAQIGSSGDYAQIGSSGDYAQIGSSGNSAQIGSSGNSAQIGSSGDYAQIGSSGDYAKLRATGDGSVIANAGLDGRAKVGKNGAIALTYKDAKGRFRIAVGYEGERLNADTWYSVNDRGEFVEVEA